MKDKLIPPGSSKGDAVHAITRAGLSAIPAIGGPAVELFQQLVQPPLEKRRGEWMREVGDRLRKLEDTGLNLDSLRQNEGFITTVMQASQIALRTHQAEKLEALKNAIENVAKGQSPDDALQHMYLTFIDSLSELHLRLLKLFQNPTPPPGMSMGGLGSVVEHNMDDMRGRRDVYTQFWKDLFARGLVSIEGMNVTMSASGLAAKRTTEMGDGFLKFISKNP